MLVNVVLISVDVSLGLGRHNDVISDSNEVVMIKITLAVNTVYSTSYQPVTWLSHEHLQRHSDRYIQNSPGAWACPEARRRALRQV